MKGAACQDEYVPDEMIEFDFVIGEKINPDGVCQTAQSQMDKRSS